MPTPASVMIRQLRNLEAIRDDMAAVRLLEESNAERLARIEAHLLLEPAGVPEIPPPAEAPPMPHVRDLVKAHLKTPSRPARSRNAEPSNG